MSIKLEVGKTYVTRSGEPVKIVSRDAGDSYPFNGSDGDCYMEGGRRSSEQITDGDLIIELQESGATPALAEASVTFQRQQFLDALMLELVRHSPEMTPTEIAGSFTELVAARDAAA